VHSSLQAFLEERKSFISPNYLRDSAAVLNAYFRETASESDPLSKESLQFWFKQKQGKVKPATLAAYLFTLHKYCAWAVAQGLLPSDPTSAIHLPPVRKPFRKTIVSLPTVRRLLAECQDPLLLYTMYCGFHAGLRFGEVVQSRPEWFSMSERLLHVTRCEAWDTKDHEDRTVPLTDQFHAFLTDSYGLPSPFMIAPKKLKAYRHRYRFDFSTRFENYVKSKGVATTFHDCRRTFCSLHVSAGTSVYKVAKWIGDDVNVVTRHYGHLSPSDSEINRAFE
jgi:integrase